MSDEKNGDNDLQNAILTKSEDGEISIPSFSNSNDNGNSKYKDYQNLYIQKIYYQQYMEKHLTDGL